MNLKGVSKEVWVRLIVVVLAFANQFLTASGINPIAVSETELYGVLSRIVTVGVAL